MPGVLHLEGDAELQEARTVVVRLGREIDRHLADVDERDRLAHFGARRGSWSDRPNANTGSAGSGRQHESGGADERSSSSGCAPFFAAGDAVPLPASSAPPSVFGFFAIDSFPTRSATLFHDTRELRLTPG